MRKARKHYTAEEKVAIRRRHLVDKEPISKFCDELAPQPTVETRFHYSESLWQKSATACSPNGDAPPRQVACATRFCQRLLDHKSKLAKRKYDALG